MDRGREREKEREREVDSPYLSPWVENMGQYRPACLSVRISLSVCGLRPGGSGKGRGRQTQGQRHRVCLLCCFLCWACSCDESIGTIKNTGADTWGIYRDAQYISLSLCLSGCGMRSAGGARAKAYAYRD